MRLAGLELVDSPLVKDSIDLAQTYLSPYLFNHVMRCWLFAALLEPRARVKADPELLAVATILHDLGLTEKFAAADRFEVDGANAARDFLVGRGVGAREVQLVWDAIALHTTRSLARHKEPEVAACCAGVVVDVSGAGLDQFQPQDVQAILAKYPRLAFKNQFKESLCGLARHKPQTTYDNGVKDIGERYVAGYKAPSFADTLQNAPYAE